MPAAAATRQAERPDAKGLRRLRREALAIALCGDASLGPEMRGLGDEVAIGEIGPPRLLRPVPWRVDVRVLMPATARWREFVNLLFNSG